MKWLLSIRGLVCLTVVSLKLSQFTCRSWSPVSGQYFFPSILALSVVLLNPQWGHSTAITLDNVAL